MSGIDLPTLRGDIVRWLREDVGHGDITSELTIEDGALAAGVLIAKQDGVVAGLDVAREVFVAVEGSFEFHSRVVDGRWVTEGTILADLSGTAKGMLKGERLALNLLQRMSGIATMTSAFVSETKGTKARILDSRKTTPGLRSLEKYAVRLGGGYNHRFGLFDGILIKDNHIVAAGSVYEATKAAVARAPHHLVVEVEVGSIEELKEALEAGAGCVLLDNMTTSEMAEAVRIVAGRIPTEASGNMTLARIREVALCGVDLISVGALTHSAIAVDISLDFSVGKSAEI